MRTQGAGLECARSKSTETRQSLQRQESEAAISRKPRCIPSAPLTTPTLRSLVFPAPALERLLEGGLQVCVYSTRPQSTQNRPPDGRGRRPVRIGDRRALSDADVVPCIGNVAPNIFTEAPIHIYIQNSRIRIHIIIYVAVYSPLPPIQARCRNSRIRIHWRKCVGHSKYTAIHFTELPIHACSLELEDNNSKDKCRGP